MNLNTKYSTSQISNFYKNNRCSWAQLYESERNIFNTLESLDGKSILDLGCGCGGLGLALAHKFSNFSYTGVDIHAESISYAKRLVPHGQFFCADLLALGADFSKAYSVVVSLSCIDWNVEVLQMLQRAWSFVAPGGCFILSARMTSTGPTVMDIQKSFQYINFEGIKSGDKAQYTVFNQDELVSILSSLPNCDSISAFGYPGIPSGTAVTPFSELLFAVFKIEKAKHDFPGVAPPVVSLNFA